MPLNFNDEPPERTVGRRKTDEELEQLEERRRENDVTYTDITVKIVGDSTSFKVATEQLTQASATRTSNLNSVFESVSEEIEEVRRATAQFGLLPFDWRYFTSRELSGLKEVQLESRSRQPSLSWEHQPDRRATLFTLTPSYTYRSVYQKLLVSDEVLDEVLYEPYRGASVLAYDLNAAVSKLAALLPTKKLWFGVDELKQETWWHHPNE